MAQRTISTKLAIEGESEYRSALQKINSEYKTLKSEMKEVASEYQTNQNSMEALQKRSEELSKAQETLTQKVEACQKGYDNAQKSVNTYQDNINDLTSKLNANQEAQSKLSDEAQKAGTEYNKYQSDLSAAEAELDRLKGTTGDTSEAEKEQNEIIENCKAKMQELQEATDGDAKVAAELQNEERNLNTELADNEDKLERAQQGSEQWEQKLNGAKTELNNTNAEIEQNDKYLEEAANSADGCATSIDEFGKKTSTAGDSLEKTNKSLDIMTTQMLQRELQKAFEGLKDALMACVDAAAEFEQQMSTVQAISGATGEDMNKLTEIAKEMGSTTTYTAEESGEALEYMALAGWKTEDMLDGLPAVLDLAAASGSDLATTSDIVTDALTAFGYEASDAAHFSDVLAASSSNSNTTVEQLGSAFQKVGPLAGTMGYSVEDVSEALGLMANSGIKAESAGTALNTMLTRMSGTNSSARNELEKLNVEMYNADGTARPLSDVIDDLRGAFSNLSDSEATEAAYNLAGQRGMSAMLAIVQSSDEDYDKLSESIDTCNGAAADMAETKLDNYAGQVTLLESAWDGLKVEIGEQVTPVLGDCVEWLTNIVNWITNFIQDNPAVVAAITGIATALGIMTAAVAALVAGMKIYQLVEKAIQAMNPFGWVTLAITAVAALAAGIAVFCSALSKNLNPGVEESKDRVKALNEEMEDLEDTVEETSDAIEENADSTDFLKNAIVNLLEKEQLSEAEKQKMADYVDELNELYPDLGLSIDETTGSLDMETEAFENLIDAAEDSSELTALAKEQEEAEKAVADATNDLNTAYDERDLVIAALNGDEDAYNQLLEEGSVKTGFMQTKTQALQKYEKQLNKEIDNGNDALDKAQGYYDDCTEACDELEQELLGLSDAEMDSYQKVGSQTDQLCSALMDLQDAYDEAQQAAAESAHEQFDMFEKVEKEAKSSVKDIEDALKSQQNYWKEYSANLQDLQSRNIDGLNEMVAEFSDGSTEAAAYVASFADMTDEELQEIVDMWRGVTDEETEWSKASADLTSGYTQEMQDMIDQFTEWINSNEDITEADKEFMIQQMESYVNDLSEEDEEYEGELAHLSEASQQYFADSMGVVGDATDQAAAALDNFTQKTANYSDSLGSFSDTMDSMQMELDELRDKYDEVKESAKESAETQFDMFEQVAEAAVTSFDDIMSGLESQIEYWNNYGENIDNLLGRNISGIQDWVGSWNDGTQDAANYAASFASLTDEQLQLVIDKFGELDSSVDFATGEVAESQTGLTQKTEEFTQEMINQLEQLFDELDFSESSREWAWNSISEYAAGLAEGEEPTSEAIQGIVGIGGVMESLYFPDEAKQMAWDSITAYADMLEEGEEPSAEAIGIILEGIGKQFSDEIEAAAQAGEDTTLGFGKGLKKGSSDAIEAGQTETQAIIDAIKETAGTHSPSWITEDVGEDTMTGFANGITNKKTDVVNTAKDAAQGAIDSFENTANDKTLVQAGKDTMEGYDSGVNSESSAVSSTLKEVADAGITTWNNSATHTVLFTSGVNTLKGFKDGLDSSKETAFTKMEQIARSSITSFQNQVNDNVLRTTGENVINGFVNGLNNRSGSLYNAMTNLANNALRQFNNTLGVHSPSTEAEWSGEKTAEGYALGVDENTKTVEQSMAELAKEALGSFVDEFESGMSAMMVTAQDAQEVITSFAKYTNTSFSAVEASTTSLVSDFELYDKELTSVTKDTSTAEKTFTSFAVAVQKDMDTVGLSTQSLSLILSQFDKQLLQTIKDVKNYANTTALYASGQDTIQGYINGLNDKSSSLNQSMMNLAQNALNSFNNTLGIHSPSTEAYSSAAQTIIGWINGIAAYTPSLEDSMSDLAQRAIAAFNDGMTGNSTSNSALLSLTNSIEQAMSSGFAPGSTEMQVLQKSAQDALSAIYDELYAAGDKTGAAAIASFEMALNTAFANGFDSTSMSILGNYANQAAAAFESYDALTTSMNTASANVSSSSSASDTYITVEIPIYENGQYTRTEIEQIAIDGINRKQVNSYAAKGVSI